MKNPENNAGNDIPFRDSFAIVSEFLARNVDKCPTRKEVQEISRDLENIKSRLEKIRLLTPDFRDIDVSDDIKKLFRLSGKDTSRLTKISFRKAASLL